MSNNLLDFTDLILIKSHHNLKIAEQILAYRIDKRRKEEVAKSERLQAANAQVQQQSAQMAAEEERKTLQLKAELEMQVVQLEKDLELRNKIQVADAQGGMDVMKAEIMPSSSPSVN